jgi:hypothetical protein
MKEEEFMQLAKAKADAGRSQEEIICFLKSNNVTLVRSIFIIKNSLSISLKEARAIVVNSEAWSAEKPLFDWFTDVFTSTDCAESS